jgi:hypothetical protein
MVCIFHTFWTWTQTCLQKEPSLVSLDHVYQLLFILTQTVSQDANRKGALKGHEEIFKVDSSSLTVNTSIAEEQQIFRIAMSCTKQVNGRKHDNYPSLSRSQLLLCVKISITDGLPRTT